MTARQAVIVVAAAHFANPMMILLVIGELFFICLPPGISC